MPGKPQEGKPEDLAALYAQIAERSAKILGEFAQKHVANSVSAAVSDELGIAKAYMELYSRMMADPYALASLSVNMTLDYLRLAQSSWLRMLGQPAEPVAEPAKSDSRFKDEDWKSNFLFDFIKGL